MSKNNKTTVAADKIPVTNSFTSSIHKIVQGAIEEVLTPPKINKIKLIAQIITLNITVNDETEINRLQITRDIVCRHLLNQSSVVVLVQRPGESRSSIRAAFSAASYALGFYHVPTIGVMIQDVEFSRKNLYPSYLSTSPPFSNEAEVIIKLLAKLQYRQVIVMIVQADLNGQEFVTVFEELRIANKIHVQAYVELVINESLPSQIAKEFSETTSNTVILCAKRPNAEKIFSAAAGFTSTGRMWIVNEASASAKNIPTGFLSIRLRQSMSSALRDALVVARDGMQFFATEQQGSNNKSAPLPPSQCSGTSITDEWTNRIGKQFYNHLITTAFSGDTNPIKFNEKGDRISVAYDILNIHQGGRTVVVGHMSEEKDLALEETSIRWPGGGLQKPLEITLPKHLRAVAVADPPFVYAVGVGDPERCSAYGRLTVEGVEVLGPWYPCPLSKGEGKADMFCCAGYAVDLLSNLSKSEANSSIHTGFSFEIHLNTSYGAVLLNENAENEHLGGYVLSGMIGELDSDMADLAIGAFSINPEREKYIDFSEPWLYHGIQILEKWKPRDSPMESFLQPLKSTLWSTLFVSVFLVGCCIFFLDLKSPFERYYVEDLFFGREENTRVSFEESMWFVWGVLLNSGVCEKTPRSFSARVLGLVWCGFCMIMVASYTANLAAFLVLDQPERSLNGVTDARLRNPSANFSYGTVTHTNTYQYFKRHVELSTMFRKMEGHNVKTPQEGINALLNGSLGAFIWDSARLEYEAARNCELRTRGALFGRSAYGIGLQKHSPWTPHITAAILRLAESGAMEKMEAKWITSVGNKVCVYETHKSPARLSLRNMRDGLILVVFGIGVGILLSIVEVKMGRKKEAERKRNQLAKRSFYHWIGLVKRRTMLQFSLAELGKNECYMTTATRQNNQSRKDFPTRKLMFNQEVFVPNLKFSSKPSKLYCSRCHNIVETIPRPVLGAFAVFCSTLLCLIKPISGVKQGDNCDPKINSYWIASPTAHQFFYCHSSTKKYSIAQCSIKSGQQKVFDAQKRQCVLPHPYNYSGRKGNRLVNDSERMGTTRAATIPFSNLAQNFGTPSLLVTPPLIRLKQASAKNVSHLQQSPHYTFDRLRSLRPIPPANIPDKRFEKKGQLMGSGTQAIGSVTAIGDLFGQSNREVKSGLKRRPHNLCPGRRRPMLEPLSGNLVTCSLSSMKRTQDGQMDDDCQHRDFRCTFSSIKEKFGVCCQRLDYNFVNCPPSTRPMTVEVDGIHRLKECLPSLYGACQSRNAVCVFDLGDYHCCQDAYMISKDPDDSEGFVETSVVIYMESASNRSLSSLKNRTKGSNSVKSRPKKVEKIEKHEAVQENMKCPNGVQPFKDPLNETPVYECNVTKSNDCPPGFHCYKSDMADSGLCCGITDVCGSNNGALVDPLTNQKIQCNVEEGCPEPFYCNTLTGTCCSMDPVAGLCNHGISLLDENAKAVKCTEEKRCPDGFSCLRRFNFSLCCPTKENICSQAMNTGLQCLASPPQTAFYFNKYMGRCESFTYTGCSGNQGAIIDLRMNSNAWKCARKL
uniref:BPTI/Kunitz inhibitor domain-containing protein n=1 Tax=Ditylenchus dipsaci TaxID=166011 RepID=A0A915E3C5_9BILA